MSKSVKFPCKREAGYTNRAHAEIPVSLYNLLMEKGNVKDYLKQGIILNDMIRSYDFFFFKNSLAFQILKTGCFSRWQQGAADESQF